MTHTLSNEHLRLELAPDLGASIVNLHARVDGAWRPILRHTTEEALAKAHATRSASPLASFTLAPFSNRIPGAAFTFEGHEYTLRPTTPEGNAQHGDVRNRPHTTVAVSEDRAEYLLDSRDTENFNYPFPLTLRTVFTLRESSVVQTLELRNVGSERMPAGLGVHPYFERHLMGAPDVALSFSARGYYPVDETLIPRGAMQAVPGELDFQQPRPIGAQEFNTLYGGLNGMASLRFVGTPYQVRLEMDPVFSHLVLFTPPDGSLAVEPVTHATDAFNLHARGVEGVGFTSLEPGEVLSGSVHYRFLSKEEDA